MPLSFVNPALLFGTLASALPVIIHFLSRRKVQRRKFSDLRFLAEVQARQTRRLNVRRLLLLLLRVLAVLLLTLGVAGPRWGGLGGGLAKHSVLMVFDTSASMGTQEDDGTRLELALADGRKMLSLLPDRSSVQILTAGAQVKALLGDWLPADAVPLNVLAGITPDGGGFDFEAVLQEALRQLRSTPGVAVDLVLFSDMQKIRKHGELSAVVERLLAERPLRILLRQTGQARAGGSVLRVQLPQRALRVGETVNLQALVRPNVPDQPFSLELDGVQIGEAVVEGPATGIHTVDFSLKVPEAGWHSGHVRKESDRLPADDSRPFVLYVPEQISVVLVHGADRAADGPAGRGGWRFLQQALDPGGRETLFKIKSAETGNLLTGDLVATDLLVLVDPDPLGRTALAGMASWVRNGGSVLLVTGDPVQQDYLQNTLLPALGFPGEKVSFQAHAKGMRTKLVGRTTSLFSGFDTAALGSLKDVMWQRWFSLQDQGAQVVLSLPGGDPLLMEREMGRGRVMILASNLRPEAGNLATSAMALPLLQRMAARLSARGDRTGQNNVLAGQNVILEPEPNWTPVEGVEAQIWLPQLTNSRPALLSWQGSRPLLQGGIAEYEGVAVFTADGDTLGLVAVSVPGAESSLVLESPAQVQRRLVAAGLNVAGDLSGTAPGKLGTLLKGRDLAPWFFLLALTVLLLELYLGRGSPAASDPHSG